MKLSNLFSRKQKTPGMDSYYHHEFHVYRDWLAVVLVFTVGVIGSGIVHFFLFMAFNKTEDERIAESGAVPVSPRLDREALKRVEESFAAKAEQFEDLRGRPVPVIDPSR